MKFIWKASGSTVGNQTFLHHRDCLQHGSHDRPHTSLASDPEHGEEFIRRFSRK
jgi:hypothetical protein